LSPNIEINSIFIVYIFGYYKYLDNAIANKDSCCSKSVFNHAWRFHQISIPFGGYTSLLLGVDQDVEPAVRKLHFDGVPDDEIIF
jgi:hypothetical protein